MRSTIATNKAPKAIGPYSQAVRYNNLLFLSGQIPLDPATGTVVGNDVAAQTERVFANIQAVLDAAGASLEHVLKTTVFLQDMNDFAKMNEVYARFFPVNPPARSAVQAARLPRDVKVEIEVIAAIPA